MQPLTMEVCLHDGAAPAAEDSASLLIRDLLPVGREREGEGEWEGVEGEAGFTWVAVTIGSKRPVRGVSRPDVGL